MNRLRALVCTLLAALPLCLSALTWTDAKGVVWSYTVSNGEATITGIPKDTAGAVTIPATLPNGSATCPVTVIGNSAFLDCSSLTSVVIPVGVISIGGSVFNDCASLTSVVIPMGVTSIEDFAFDGCASLASVVIPKGVTSIGYAAFRECSSLASVVIPEGVTSIEGEAFADCSSLTSVIIPESVTAIGSYAFGFIQCKLVFSGRPPRVDLSEIAIERIEYPEEYTTIWERALLLAYQASTVSVQSEMTTPKTIKVTYNVISRFSRAKVRAVAWKDGVRSFANIVPVRTAAEGSPEGVPNGGEVTTGVEHTFIWQVSADWNIDLAKVAVEVLVEEAGLLPQDLVTIPATETHAKMTITTNVPTTEQLFNALIWLYAEGDEALVVTGGVMKVNGTAIANGARLPDAEDWNGSYNLWTDGDYRSWSTAWKANATALLNYLYGKMGFKVLEGADLSYARDATEIGLPVSGELDQVSVKISEE